MTLCKDFQTETMTEKYISPMTAIVFFITLLYDVVFLEQFKYILNLMWFYCALTHSWHVPAIRFIGMKQLVLKVANILEKLRYLWKCEIWGNIVKIWYFVNNCLIEAWIQKFFCHMCDTYNCDYLKHSRFRFNLINFQLDTDFPSQFCVFDRKIT